MLPTLSCPVICLGIFTGFPWYNSLKTNNMSLSNLNLKKNYMTLRGFPLDKDSDLDESLIFALHRNKKNRFTQRFWSHIKSERKKVFPLRAAFSSTYQFCFTFILLAMYVHSDGNIYFQNQFDQIINASDATACTNKQLFLLTSKPTATGFLKSIYQKPLDNLPTSIEPINFMQ